LLSCTLLPFAPGYSDKAARMTDPQPLLPLHSAGDRVVTARTVIISAPANNNTARCSLNNQAVPSQRTDPDRNEYFPSLSI
jgi:hypothetical protein